MRAVIQWVPKEEGGRSRLPTGDGPPFYSPEVRFLDEPWPNPDVAWSMIVRKDHESSDPYHWVADVEFRVFDAPHDSLREGREFELYEGMKCVARGKLVGEAITPARLESGSSRA